MVEFSSHKVLMSPELMEQWASRDAQGRLLRWEWGEPDEEGFYIPTITTVDDGARLVTAESLAKALEARLPEHYSGHLPLDTLARQLAADDAAAILQALDSA